MIITLKSFTSDSPCEQNVLTHDSDPIGVNSAHVGILKETDQISLRSFLKGHDSRTLESRLDLDLVGDFLDKSLERQFPDEEFGGPLILPDFSDGDGAWLESVWLLDASSGWGGLLGGGLVGVLLSRSLDAGGAFSGCGFGSSHWYYKPRIRGLNTGMGQF